MTFNKINNLQIFQKKVRKTGKKTKLPPQVALGKERKRKLLPKLNFGRWEINDYIEIFNFSFAISSNIIICYNNTKNK